MDPFFDHFWSIFDPFLDPLFDPSERFWPEPSYLMGSHNDFWAGPAQGCSEGPQKATPFWTKSGQK